MGLRYLITSDERTLKLCHLPHGATTATFPTKKVMATAVLETATFGFEDRRAIHCATLPTCPDAILPIQVRIEYVCFSHVRQHMMRETLTHSSSHIKKGHILSRLAKQISAVGARKATAKDCDVFGLCHRDALMAANILRAKTDSKRPMITL